MDGDLIRRIAPTVIMPSAINMPMTATGLPDITKMPQTSSSASTSSDTWNAKSPSACNGEITNIMITSSPVSTVRAGSAQRSRN